MTNSWGFFASQKYHFESAICYYTLKYENNCQVPLYLHNNTADNIKKHQFPIATHGSEGRGKVFLSQTAFFVRSCLAVLFSLNNRNYLKSSAHMTIRSKDVSPNTSRIRSLRSRVITAKQSKRNKTICGRTQDLLTHNSETAKSNALSVLNYTQRAAFDKVQRTFSIDNVTATLSSIH